MKITESISFLGLVAPVVEKYLRGSPLRETIQIARKDDGTKTLE